MGALAKMGRSTKQLHTLPVHIQNKTKYNKWKQITCATYGISLENFHFGLV